MTLGQYRALVGYMNYWTRLDPEGMGLDAAIRDCGIGETREEVIAKLFRAGWAFDETTGLISYGTD